MIRMPDDPSFFTGRLRLDELPAEERSFLECGPGALHRSPDVLVVGGGVMGVLAATAFIEAGAGVVELVEALPQLGAGATGGALGMLTPEPHRGTNPDALVELGRAGLAGWRRLNASVSGSLGRLDPLLAVARLAIGGTLDVGDRTPAARPELVGSMVAGLGRWHPRLRDLRAERAWTCFRPHHPDGLPVIERVPGADNAWFTSGHYRTGILAAPATAAAFVEWAASGARPALAEPFAAMRLAEVA